MMRLQIVNTRGLYHRPDQGKTPLMAVADAYGAWKGIDPNDRETIAGLFGKRDSNTPTDAKLVMNGYDTSLDSSAPADAEYDIATDNDPINSGAVKRAASNDMLNSQDELPPITDSTGSDLIYDEDLGDVGGRLSQLPDIQDDQTSDLVNGGDNDW